MFMKILSLEILLSLLLIIALGCKKEVDQFIPVQDSVDFDFSQEFSEEQDTLFYHIKGVERITLTTPIGAEFIIKRSMFEYLDGSFCDCEEILIKIIELDKKRDYLVHQRPTVSNNQLLISAGAYHFAAYHNQRPLQMIEGEQLCLVLPSDQLDEEMELFYGEESGGFFDWQPANSVPESRAFVKAGEWQTDSSLIIGYECFSDRLGWINIDKFASKGDLNPVRIELDPQYDNKNTVVFAVLLAEKALVNLYYDQNEGEFAIDNIPPGWEVMFIAVSKKSTDLFELATEEVTIGEHHFQSLSFRTKKLEEIKDFLKRL